MAHFPLSGEQGHGRSLIELDLAFLGAGLSSRGRVGQMRTVVGSDSLGMVAACETLVVP